MANTSKYHKFNAKCNKTSIIKTYCVKIYKQFIGQTKIYSHLCNTKHSIKHKSFMDIKEKDIIYSESVKAGKRIYYLDVKLSRNGDRYVSITESKKIVEDESIDNPRFTFEKHKIFLYREDFEKFAAALNKVIAFASGTPVDDAASSDGDKPQLLADADLNIDINF